MWNGKRCCYIVTISREYARNNVKSCIFYKKHSNYANLVKIDFKHPLDSIPYNYCHVHIMFCTTNMLFTFSLTNTPYALIFGICCNYNVYNTIFVIVTHILFPQFSLRSKKNIFVLNF